MAKVHAQLRLDAAVLASVDATAKRLGRSRDEMIEDSVRRDLAGRLLSGIFGTRPQPEEQPLNDDEVTALVYDELHQARRDRNRPQE